MLHLQRTQRLSPRQSSSLLIFVATLLFPPPILLLPLREPWLMLDISQLKVVPLALCHSARISSRQAHRPSFVILYSQHSTIPNFETFGCFIQPSSRSLIYLLAHRLYNSQHPTRYSDRLIWWQLYANYPSKFKVMFQQLPTNSWCFHVPLLPTNGAILFPLNLFVASPSTMGCRSELSFPSR